MTPLNAESHPRACVFCNGYCVHSDVVLVRIDWPEKDRPQDKRYTEVVRGYSGIRSICTTCLDGLAAVRALGSLRATSEIKSESEEKTI